MYSVTNPIFKIDFYTQLLKSLLRKASRIEQKLDKLMEVKKDDKENDEALHNGIDLRRVYGSNPYTYGLNLMDALFDKDKLSKSLLFGSKKSDKPGLDKDRVKMLFETIEEKFKGSAAYKEWTLKHL